MLLGLASGASLPRVSGGGDGGAAFAAAKSRFDAQQNAKLADLRTRMAAEVRRPGIEAATIPGELGAFAPRRGG